MSGFPESSTSSATWRLFDAATRATADRMTTWSGGAISLELDGIVCVPMHELFEHVPGADRLATLVLIEGDGDIGGILTRLFDDASLGKFLERISGVPVSSEELSELHESVLMETGNILASAFTGTICEQSGYLVLPSPPTLLRDYALSVLEQASFDQAMTHDQLVLSRTRFEKDGETLDWQLIFVPNSAMRAWLDEADQTQTTTL